MNRLRVQTKEECLCKMTKQYSDLDQPRAEMMTKLFLLNDDLLEMKQKALAEHNISEGRLMVLISIWGSSKPMTATDIADSIGVTKATITGLVDSLMKDNYIQKINCENDRRSVYLSLTDAGKSFLEVVLPAHSKKISDLARCLSDQETKQLLKTLNKLHDFMLQSNS